MTSALTREFKRHSPPDGGLTTVEPPTVRPPRHSPPDGGLTLILRPLPRLTRGVGHTYGGFNRTQVRARPVCTADSTPRHPTHLNALSGRWTRS